CGCPRNRGCPIIRAASRRSEQVSTIVCCSKVSAMELSDEIDREALALFLELERAPLRAKPYSDDTRRLAQLLGLMDEWWRGQHVNDRSERPCHRPHLVAHGDWHRCRAVREVLLEMARKAAA